MILSWALRDSVCLLVFYIFLLILPMYSFLTKKCWFNLKHEFESYGIIISEVEELTPKYSLLDYRAIPAISSLILKTNGWSSWQKKTAGHTICPFILNISNSPYRNFVKFINSRVMFAYVFHGLQNFYYYLSKIGSYCCSFSYMATTTVCN